MPAAHNGRVAGSNPVGRTNLERRNMITPGMTVEETRNAFLALPIAHTLRSRLQEPWRSYHVWAHPMAMIERAIEAEREGVGIHDAAAVVGFCLWHDAVYDPTAQHGRNEELSALLCEAEMPEHADRISVRAAACATRATTRHLLTDLTTCPDMPLMLDIDLAILGMDEEIFLAYEEGIHVEYAHVSPTVRRTVRTDILKRFLARDRLYMTDWAHARWEATARANLKSSIRRMAAA